MGIGKRLKRNGKLTYEHKEVMEEFLGRPLICGEVIHHIDGDPFNNSIENLELMTRGTHTACHNRGRGKLCVDDIPFIRLWLKKGFSLNKIGKAFGVSHGTIMDIRDGFTWINY